MEDGVAEAADHGDGGKAHEGMRHRYQGERTADDGKAAGQDGPGAEAVDRETRRRLGEARHAVEDARQQADIGETEAGLLAHDQQHRGEGELIVVARSVNDADQADDAEVAIEGSARCRH